MTYLKELRIVHRRESAVFFFLMIRRPPRSTLFPYTDALPICPVPEVAGRGRQRPQLASGQQTAGHPHPGQRAVGGGVGLQRPDRKSTRLNSSHANISYAVFCLKKKKTSILRVPYSTRLLRCSL